MVKSRFSGSTKNVLVAARRLLRSTKNVLVLLALPLFLAADDAKPELDGATKARMYAALTALVILWFLLIALISLGATFTRRYMKSPFDGRPSIPREPGDDWAMSPMHDEND